MTRFRTLILTALAALLAITPATAASVDTGYVLYSNARTLEALGVLIAEGDTVTEARRMYRNIDDRDLEDSFDVRVRDERSMTRTQAANLGVDDFKSFYITQGRTGSGTVIAFRDGTIVGFVLYLSFDEPDFDLAFDFAEDVIADGLDARKPYGFSVETRDIERAKPTRRTTPTPEPTAM